MDLEERILKFLNHTGLVTEHLKNLIKTKKFIYGNEEAAEFLKDELKLEFKEFKKHVDSFKETYPEEVDNLLKDGTCRNKNFYKFRDFLLDIYKDQHFTLFGTIYLPEKKDIDKTLLYENIKRVVSETDGKEDIEILSKVLFMMEEEFGIHFNIINGVPVLS